MHNTKPIYRPHLWRTRKYARGFTLVEILASLTILLIGILALVSLFPQGMNSARSAENYTMATLLGQQKMEDIVREYRSYNDWSSNTITNYEAFTLEPDYAWRASVDTTWGFSSVSLVIRWRERGDYTEETITYKLN